jgi:hypothetical protein
VTVPALSVAAVVSVGARWFCWFRGSGSAVGNDELAHHSVVFMQQRWQWNMYGVVSSA